MLVMITPGIVRTGNAAASNPEASVTDIFSPSPALDPSHYYDSGVGNPAVSTADYYHLDGLYWFRPYDMLNNFGTVGASIAASRGRYFWLVTPDHPSSTYGWAGGQDFMGGFSDDPGVLPATIFKLFGYDNSVSAPNASLFSLYQAAYLVYNPDDATYPFYLYAEGNNTTGAAIQHEEGLARSTDLLTWVMYGPTHPNFVFADWSSFQRVVRRGSGDWYSVGLVVRSGDPNIGTFGQGVWTSTDGLTDWTPPAHHVTDTVGNITYEFTPSDEVTIGGQKYCLMREDARTDGLGQFLSLVPVDSSFNVLASPSPIRLANYVGTYPGPTYFQECALYLEDGLAHIYAHRGFVPSSSAQGLVSGATYADGGGLWEEFVDYRTKIVDASAASSAAPVGVTASCTNGTVSLSWLNALPQQTYRVYRGSSSGSQTTLVGDVTGTSTTDTPTTGQQWWYKVVTLSGGVEHGNRVVHTYVSNNARLVNDHIDRVLTADVSAATIDITWLASVVSWLSSNNLTHNLLFWTDAAFGTAKDGSNVISKIYDLGCTLLPRGGDFTTDTGNTTYSATAINNLVPGWVNGNGLIPECFRPRLIGASSHVERRGCVTDLANARNTREWRNRRRLIRHRPRRFVSGV